MKKYKVLIECELLGSVQAVDSIVELSDEDAAPCLADGRVAEVTE